MLESLYFFDNLDCRVFCQELSPEYFADEVIESFGYRSFYAIGSHQTRVGSRCLNGCLAHLHHRSRIATMPTSCSR